MDKTMTEQHALALRASSHNSAGTPLAGQTADALMQEASPTDRVAAWLASTPSVVAEGAEGGGGEGGGGPPHHHRPHPPRPGASFRARARTVPGAGSLARLAPVTPAGPGALGAAAAPPPPPPPASPFAAAAASPFVASPPRPRHDAGAHSPAAGPASPDPPPGGLARLPNAAAADAWAWSDGGSWGCNSSDSEWARPGPPPGWQRRGAAPSPPRAEGGAAVLLPWDM